MTTTLSHFLKRAAAVVASLAILSTALITGLSLMSTSPGSAAVASTTHSHPNRGVPGVSYLCQPTTGYSCTPGYTATNATGWAASDYGCPYASGCPSTPHNCTLYAAFRLMKNGYGNPGWAANANDWAQTASRHGVAVDQTPHVGAIAQWNGGVGHVAYVEASGASGITLTMDDYYTLNPWPVGYTASVHIAPGSPAWPDNFIHFDDQGTGSQPPSQSSASSNPSGTTVTIFNAAGGVYWRSQTDWNTPVKNPGYGVYSGDRVSLLCWQRGTANTPPYNNNPLWYQAAVIAGQGKGQGWVNDHFLETGGNVPNVPVSGVPNCQSAPAPSPTGPAPTITGTMPTPVGTTYLQPQAGATALQPAAGATTLQPASGATQLQSPTATGPSGSSPTIPTANIGNSPTTPPAQPQPVQVTDPTYTETVGGVSHTWSNYSNAGGNQGPSISAFTSVQIACKVTGFQVADGNTWWYRIASSPWNDNYYVSADAFYNNGATSGSLHGTPFVDGNIPEC